jgi:hypothetical protein
MKGIKAQIEWVARQALVAAAQAVREDLVESQTMPFESGHLQNSATYVDVGRIRDNKVAVVSDTVYARRKFFHPEFEFDQSVNARAGGRWYDAYVSGNKRDLAFIAFKKAMEEGFKR